MQILAFNPSHDGGAAIVRDGRLKCTIEAEKDSFLRYESLTPHSVLTAFRHADGFPDVFAATGGVKSLPPPLLPYAAGYNGVSEQDALVDSVRMFGRDTTFFSSSHERAHLLCAYGMSPFRQGDPCYALIWEGAIGSFYEIDEHLRITPFDWVVSMPGSKYEFIYVVADNSGVDACIPGLAGKVMALAGCATYIPPTPEESKCINKLLDISDIYSMQKELCADWPIYRVGVNTPIFHRFARHFSDALYDRFFAFGRSRLTRGLPLIISGGCGLNCEWNSRFRDSGLFADVFVPPCPNDSGLAIGTAIDAQFRFTGKAKIEWDVYAGDEYVVDRTAMAFYGQPTVAELEERFEIRKANREDVARFLAEGNVVAWMQGRYEMGPRALGNRSLLAAPFELRMRDRLNDIKQREPYRPVAPVCLEQDAALYFEPASPSPHMLYFQKVRLKCLAAVTHVDGTARAQTVNSRQNPPLFELLTRFKEQTGHGVLCNTSLNFKGRGFINRYSDLLRYCAERGVDGFVMGDMFGTLRPQHRAHREA